MKKGFFSVVLFAAMALLSCSTENDIATAGSDNEILFNVEEVPFKPDSASGGAATRATKLTSVSSFKLYAYDANNAAIANGVTYNKSGNSWSTTSKVFWPQTGNVTFYAFSPANNSSVSFDTSNKQLTYTAPTAQASQQDVLYAYKTSARPTNNTVDLTFNHANAAFSVNARLASGCTATVNVSGVSLVNVKPTNTLTFTNGSATASGNNISSTLDCSAKTLTTSNQAISSSPLIIPPQSVTAWSGTGSLANTYLAVTCKVESNGTYAVGSASANGTVYVPMTKTLNKGEDNSVNLVFGTLTDGKRSYGRDDKGNRITISEIKNINNITDDDLGKVICTDGTVYNSVSEASAAGKTAAAMIACLKGGESNIAIALHDMNGNSMNYNNAVNRAGNYTPSVLDYGWDLPSQADWEEITGSFGNDANGLISALGACGGSRISGTYWTSDETTIDDNQGEDPIQKPAAYTYDTDTNNFEAVNIYDYKQVRYIFYF